MMRTEPGFLGGVGTCLMSSAVHVWPVSRSAWRKLSTASLDSSPGLQATSISSTIVLSSRPSTVRAYAVSVTLDAGGLLCKDNTLSMFTGDGACNTYPIKLGEGESGSTPAYLSIPRDPLNPPIWAAFRSETGKIYKTKISKDVLKVLMDQ